MTDQNDPDGQDPVRPPSVPEVPAGSDYTGDAPGAPPPPGPDFDATVTPGTPPPGPPGFNTDGYDNQPTRERADYGGDPSTLQPQQPPPYPQQPPAQSPPTVAVPGGPPPFDPNRPFAGSPPPPVEEEKGGATRPGGLLVAGLIAVVLLLGGALAFVATQSGDDDDEDATSTTVEDEEEEEEPEPEPTNSVVVEPTTTTSTTTTSTTTTTTTTTIPAAPGSVDREFVSVAPIATAFTEADELDLIAGVIADGDLDFVSSADDVFGLCAGLASNEAVRAQAIWTRDSTDFETTDFAVLEPGTAGSCIGGSEPLPAGTYEVNFVDERENVSSVTNFTVGFPIVNQVLRNDSGTELCRINIVESTASNYEVIDLAPTIAPDEEVNIDIADTEQAILVVPCDESITFEEVLFTPSADPVGMTTGISEIPDISSGAVEALFGEIESYDRVLGPQEQASAILELGNRPEFGRVATLDPSVTLCTAFFTGGPLTDATIVWEFNNVIIAEIPASAREGVIGTCIEQGGTPFGTGSYQTYVVTAETRSRDVATFTAGRAQAIIAFENDTGQELCEVGFSPTLTNWYTFYGPANGDVFAPGEVFTLPAPVAEVDIRTLDCNDQIVTEVLDVAPTDQIVSVTTGQPV